MIQLGQKCKDKVTGFSGIATGIVYYLSGCNQVLLVPPVSPDGRWNEAQWFDLQRVEVTDANALVLDNGNTPGPDKPAPKR